MRLIKGYPVCENCIHTTLHSCKKFNEYCPSFSFDGVRYQTACYSCLGDDSYEFGIPEETVKPNEIGYFHLPGPENMQQFKALLAFQHFYPDACYPNRKVSEIYGSFPGAIWNGRTTDYGYKTPTIQEIDLFRRELESLGLSMNLTWNNHLVSGTDIFDRYCNNITEIFHNGKHSITIASEELYNYLKEKFPNFKYYQSVIVSSNDKEFHYNDKFDMQLMVRNLNNNWDELLKIPEEQRGRIEFLCNDICTPICHRMGHYNIVNSCLLNRSDETCLGNYCTVDHDFSWFNARRWPITINPEDIDSYINNGFVHFKICGRWEEKIYIAMKLARYFVKPEYQDDAMCWIYTGTMETESVRKENLKKALEEAEQVQKAILSKQ